MLPENSPPALFGLLLLGFAGTFAFAAGLTLGSFAALFLLLILLGLLRPASLIHMSVDHETEILFLGFLRYPQTVACHLMSSLDITSDCQTQSHLLLQQRKQ